VSSGVDPDGRANRPSRGRSRNWGSRSSPVPITHLAVRDDERLELGRHRAHCFHRLLDAQINKVGVVPATARIDELRHVPQRQVHRDDASTHDVVHGDPVLPLLRIQERLPNDLRRRAEFFGQLTGAWRARRSGPRAPHRPRAHPVQLQPRPGPLDQYQATVLVQEERPRRTARNHILAYIGKLLARVSGTSTGLSLRGDNALVHRLLSPGCHRATTLPTFDASPRTPGPHGFSNPPDQRGYARQRSDNAPRSNEE